MLNSGVLNRNGVDCVFLFLFWVWCYKRWILSGVVYNYDNKNKLMLVLLFLFIVNIE